MYNSTYLKNPEYIDTHTKIQVMVVARGGRRMRNGCLLTQGFLVGRWNALEPDHGGGGTALIVHFTELKCQI